MRHIAACLLIGLNITAAHASDGGIFGKPAQAQQESRLPVPRFVTLKSADVNLRAGPGVRYPVIWVYRKEGLPMEVVEEFEQWRKLKDIDGEMGWAHQSLLSGRRRVIIDMPEVVLYRQDSENSPPVLRAEQGVIAEVIECQLEWCRLQIDNVKGWARKQAIWGVYAHELIED